MTKKTTVGLIDYGRGNLRSVEKALEKVGAQVKRISSPTEFQNIDAIVLPGVGAFGDAMKNLEERNLVDPILKWLKSAKPFLGICLGYQLLFEESEETPGVRGLGFLHGKNIHFPNTVGKIPHIGWNQVQNRDCPLLKNITDNSFFYHVHSYYPSNVPKDWIACETEYNGVTFVSGISKSNIHAFQFHPEKSQQNGLTLLGDFLASLKKCN